MYRTVVKGSALTALLVSSLLACTPLAQNGNSAYSSPNAQPHGVRLGSGFSGSWWPFGGHDMWSRIQKESHVVDASSIPQVQKHIHRYAQNKANFERIAENSRPYLYYIYKEAHKRNLPVELALLPIIESDFDPYAYSNRGASGLWQIMPSVASEYGIKQNFWYDGRRDIVASTNAALDHLTYLHNYFHGDLLLTLAAYDAGRTRVTNAMEQNAKHGLPTDYWSLPLPKEAKEYVPRLLAVATIVNNPRRYGINLPDIRYEPYLRQVDISQPIDLAQAAKLAQINLKELYRLNPGYNRFRTGPDGHSSHRLILPVRNAAVFAENIRYAAATHGNLVVAQRDLTHERLPARSTVHPDAAAFTLAESIAAAFKNSENLARSLEDGDSHPKALAESNAPQKPNVIHISNRSSAGIKEIKNLNYRQTLNFAEADTKNFKVAVSKQSQIKRDEYVKVTQTHKKSTHQNTKKNPSKIKAASNTQPKKIQIAQNTRTVHYKIKPGDSLWKIAKHHNVSVENLKHWNNIKKESSVRDGKKLIIHLS